MSNLMEIIFILIVICFKIMISYNRQFSKNHIFIKIS